MFFHSHGQVSRDGLWCHSRSFMPFFGNPNENALMTIRRLMGCIYIYIGQLLVLVCSSWLHIHEIWKMSTARKTGRDRSGVIHTYGTKKLHKWWSQMNYICPFTTVWIGGIDQGYGWACVWIGALNSEPRPYIYSIYIYICVCVFAYINVCIYIYCIYTHMPCYCHKYTIKSQQIFNPS